MIQVGGTIQNYRVVRELGTGAMGAVYEGLDTLIERPVAIKMLRAEIARQPELIERFRTEAITLAKLNYPNIALLYNFFRDGEDYFMVMEYVAGRTLENIIRESSRLDTDLTARIMRQTLDGLAHAHSMGVLHRDVKPANIMVTADGRAKVTDFGIARVLGSSRQTRTGRIIGTLEYIAPERIRGDESDPRSDLYSSGVVLFEMLTGRLPFTADTDFALIKAHTEEPPPRLADVLGERLPEEWEQVVMRAMAKSPDDRFQSAEEFRDAIPGGAAVLSTRSMGSGATHVGATATAATVAMAPATTYHAGAPAPTTQKPAVPIALIVGTLVVILAIFATAFIVRGRRDRAAKEALQEQNSHHVAVSSQSESARSEPVSQSDPIVTPLGPAVQISPEAPPKSAARSGGNNSGGNGTAKRRKDALSALDGGSSTPPAQNKKAESLRALQ